MRHTQHLVAVASCCFLYACGGGSDTPPPPPTEAVPSNTTAVDTRTFKKTAPPSPLRFVMDYLPESVPGSPFGRIVVSPRPGIAAMADGDLILVELALHGERLQKLEKPNDVSGEPVVQEKYVFRLPEGVRPGAYACVPQKHPSELHMMTAPSRWSVVPFELCPGTPLQIRDGMLLGG